MNAPIDIGATVLRTPRLILRPWRADDLEDFYAYARVDGVGQLAGWRPHANMEESRRILNMFIAERRTFCLEYEGRAVGSVGIETYPEDRFAWLAALKGREIGYVLAKDLWGRGLMTEAVRAVIDYLFEEVGLDFIVLAHYERNARSRRVIEKCGFTFAHRAVRGTMLGTAEDSLEYLLLRVCY
ncbi:MAG: GNAT family N-acetyltransferase [Clostridia bacterium]|nr:GNAT family N-acetyltransferase [Clostridia bacterium]